jgi:hypothetical protein
MITLRMSQPLKATLLFFLLLVCGAGFVVTQKLGEQLPPPAPRDLFAVVNEQLAAFRSSDFRTAYRHAATGMQHKFTLPQFEKMVRQEYPEMVRRYRVEFGLVQVQGPSAVVQVFFLAGDGSVRSFLYSLIHEEDAWRIAGVEELKGYRAADGLGGTHA